MTCAFSPTGNFVACGGLDNLCSIYKLPDRAAPIQANLLPHQELSHHEGYLSCCRFVEDDRVITSSGDGTCVLWDVNRKAPVHVFKGHYGDVMSVAVNAREDLFVSGSTDGTSKVWDYRSKKDCVGTFVGHESDVNSVSLFPDGRAFVSGSDDSSCRLFDMRAYRQLNRYFSDSFLCGVTSVDFSATGRILFAGYDDYICHGWDTQLGVVTNATGLSGHENRVSCLGVCSDGRALCTGSWDTMLKVWA